MATVAAALTLAAAAHAQDGGGQDPLGYCTPANTVFDPRDIRRDASPPSLPPGFSRRRVPLGFSTPLIEAGPRDSAEAIVFVHGYPGSSLDWQGVFRAVPDGARVVAFDLLGLGKADKPWVYDYTAGDLADFSALTGVGGAGRRACVA